LTLDSRQGFVCASTIKPEPLQVKNCKYSVVCSKFYHENLYIEVEGKYSVVCSGFYYKYSLELMDGRSTIHLAGRPLLPVSTDFRTWDTLVNRLRSVAIKFWPEPTQSVADRPTLVPFDLCFGPTWSMCHKHSCSDIIFGGILNILIIS
jgi:hypothetical protein